MAINRSKALSIYQTEAKRLNEEDQEDFNTDISIKQNQPLENQEIDKVELSQTQEEVILMQEQQNQTKLTLKEGSLLDYDTPKVPLKEPIVCEHVQNAYESVMIFQLRRMIRINTGPFAVMLKILIQGDPKRKYE